ncbi:3-ketoacyl- reductase [Pseudomonas amygdali pv. mori]|uniref:3-ketoacyl-reductase n=1 Tax=Pseudomonas amygdali pv. mori TaxID=34065 RepID=A0A0P9UVF6_PSEA0|nr:3-ketoacyl- reductase [Pseudomonas amygdali pv. mori]
MRRRREMPNVNYRTPGLSPGTQQRAYIRLGLRIVTPPQPGMIDPLLHVDQDQRAVALNIHDESVRTFGSARLSQSGSILVAIVDRLRLVRDPPPKENIMIEHLKLAGKVALVQGGSRGIGAAIVQRLAKEGAAVAFTYVSSEVNALEIQDSIVANGGRALAIRADSADEKAIRQAVQTTAETLGRLDILVNNAGILAIAPLNEFSMQDFDKTLAINVRSVFIASQEAARHMEEGGRIINIGSTNADRMPFAGGATYAMSKSALIGLTKGMARDLGPQGITVNNVQPGPVDTDMNPAQGEFAETLKALMALPRYGTSEEIASFVAYLAGPEAGYITGASLTIDGGFSA